MVKLVLKSLTIFKPSQKRKVVWLGHVCFWCLSTGVGFWTAVCKIFAKRQAVSALSRSLLAELDCILHWVLVSGVYVVVHKFCNSYKNSTNFIYLNEVNLFGWFCRKRILMVYSASLESNQNNQLLNT